MREEKIIEQLNLELNQRDSDVFHRIDWHGGYHPEESAPQSRKPLWWTLTSRGSSRHSSQPCGRAYSATLPREYPMLDINPPLKSMKSNSKWGKVITSDSIEGKSLLNEMGEVENESLEVVVNRLMEILDQQDYLSTPNNFLVVSTSDQEDTVLVEQGG